MIQIHRELLMRTPADQSIVFLLTVQYCDQITGDESTIEATIMTHLMRNDCGVMLGNLPNELLAIELGGKFCVNYNTIIRCIIMCVKGHNSTL